MRTETKWASIASLILFAGLIIEKLLGLQTSEALHSWLPVNKISRLLIFVFVYLLMTKEKRDRELNGSMTWPEGFQACTIMTLISIPLSTLLVYVFITAINPGFAYILAERAGEGSLDIEPFNYFLKTHLMSLIFGGLLFSLLFPLFTRRSTS